MQIFFPKNIECISCSMPIPKSNPYSLCKYCYSKIVALDRNKTKYDEVILNLKKEKYKGKIIFNDIFIIFKYNDIMKEIIHKFKYQNCTYLANFFADVIYNYINKENIVFDYILPVPVHDYRLSHRGYNQMILITKLLNKKHGYEIYDQVKRVKNTPDMYHLDKKERIEIMKESFLAQKDNKLSGKKILILDDVLTTGSTIENLGKEILRKNLDISLEALVISRPSKK